MRFKKGQKSWNNGLTSETSVLVRKIAEPIFDRSEKEKTTPGYTGILVNGVEILNYKSTDQVFYGKLRRLMFLIQVLIMML